MEKELQLSPGIDNIFAIDNPTSWICDLRLLSGEYPLMWIQAHTQNGENVLHLIFRGVYFFEGPTQWVGADFKVSTHEQCVSLLERLGWLRNIEQSNLEKYVQEFYLITATSLQYDIRILARAVYLSEKIPEFT